MSVLQVSFDAAGTQCRLARLKLMALRKTTRWRNELRTALLFVASLAVALFSAALVARRFMTG
jgi:hypothetical protein